MHDKMYYLHQILIRIMWSLLNNLKFLGIWKYFYIGNKLILIHCTNIGYLIILIKNELIFVSKKWWI